MKDPTHPSAPSAGDVLIAHPDMPDNLFSHTLVYLHTHRAEGSLGLILNRPSGQRLGAILDNPGLPQALLDLPVYYGGPVQEDQFLLSLFVCDPLQHHFRMELNPDFECLETLGSDPCIKLRAFIGYASWMEGQLETELRQKDWLWTTTDEVMLADRPTPALWELLARGDYRWQKIRRVIPQTPELN